MRKWILMSKSDEALMDAYAKGQALAFECLYLRHKRSLFSFIRRQCSNHAISEELTHDVWLAVINQASTYKPSAKFKTWIYRIAHNRLVDYWRKYGSSTHVLFEDISDYLNSEQVSSEDMALRSLEINELFKSLEVLSVEQMVALLLRVEGFSYSEIADITETQKETVKSRLRYTTKRLRVAMEVSA